MEQMTGEDYMFGYKEVEEMSIDANYKELHRILGEAYFQSSDGKGSERHAQGENFDSQPIMWIEEYFPSFQLGQAVKKMHESQRMDKAAAMNELRGAIVYIAARIRFLELKADGKEE